MVSYAQNGEDVVLARVFDSVPGGFYIDVGAAHPRYDSVTKHFYDRGWHGINVEPHPDFFALLERDRPRDLNLNVGVSDRKGRMTFYEHPELAGSSTFSSEVAATYRGQGIALREHTIEVTTLAEICELHAEHEIDFLKIDVEGHEAAVLAGADFERFRPRVLVVEAIEPTTQRQSVDPWESLVLAASYSVVLFDGVNRFYVAEEAAELAQGLGAPASAVDDYVPHRHIEEIQARDVALAERDAALAERAAALLQLDEDLRSERARVEGLQVALSETRGRLAQTRLELRDARYELQATVQALSDSDPFDVPTRG
jgi:FkbM family methyltransferase